MSEIMRAVVLTLFLGTTVGGDWTSCQPGCKCKWVSGKKSADCIKSDLRNIPTSLSSDIQSLDLSENQLDRLPSEAFKSVGLIHLHKIYLRECNIKEVDRDAFKGLGILVEIDLSDNRIHILQPGTFNDNIRLRQLFFNRNPIQKIGANLFTNLLHLQSIDMVDCSLSEIEDKAFLNVTNLQHLKLNGNKLTHIKVTTINELKKLRSLVLHDNPWKCDCHLRDLRNWVVDTNLYSSPTACVHPAHLRGKQWNILQPEEFACKPIILWPTANTHFTPSSKEVTLACKVTGNPMPSVHWFLNSRQISNNAEIKYNSNRYTLTSNVLNDGYISDRWFNLTINHVSVDDKGQFRCVAKSPGGIVERNVTLAIVVDSDGFIGTANNNDSWPLIIGFTTGTTALLIITLILCCWFCCRQKQSEAKKSIIVSDVPTNGDAVHHITSSSEQEKSLLTVNPVQKPPRRYEAQIPSGTDAVEMSELNRKLLDESSIQGNGSTGEEEHVADYLDKRREKKDATEAHPPDLLSFPSRSHNISPANSSLSNGFDNISRTSLYPSVQQAHPNPALHYNFGTLPYSRSHSPFSPSVPVVLPRQGYVTIPRRPRIPSWSSAPTPSLLDDPLSPIKAEPVYDNLGPRTTADGSSVLSLNKSFTETPRARNASKSPNVFLYDTNKRPSLASEREVKKDGILKRTSSADGDIVPVRAKAKVAPKPPPKPKKDGPLFEDEGEDGTEV